MELVKSWKNGRDAKRLALSVIDEEIASLKVGKEVSGEMTLLSDGAKSDRIAELMKKRREVKYGNLEAGDVLKVVGNIAVVAILVGFEMNHILNQKGSRFIKTL